ncbi:MAG: 16S rRNA (adenine(1518)-N(6)/adenine(1519)-N(6))-dimethyltransferase RsmA [Candidatus Nanohaloarchaeota archaeon QJJ-5]|nr:16S rRNA (adenine(1518)-N(6)/adenine(1519)-N(6))-dimethyltransferase RsmA [Candidatus Nanohaloarchaeota archaeon QJJ-5]
MIQELLARYGIEADKQQGQHFLASERILDKEVDAADIEADDVVLEIGAGLGTLTERLAEKADRVIAVEKDQNLVSVLEDRLSTYDNVTITQGDIMDMEWPSFDRCVSNPPYHLSSELIEALGTRQRFSVMVLQKQFADRLTAEPGEDGYSRLTVMARYYFIPVVLETVGADLFYPRPEVDSSLVKLYPRKDRHGIQDEEAFFRTSRALFTHKRKKVRNAVVDARHILNTEKDKVKAVRDEVPHSEQRVINLDIPAINDICQFLEDEL